MFCPNCGAQVNDGEKFCQNCGAPMEQKPAQPQYQQPQYQQPQYQQPQYQQQYQQPQYQQPAQPQYQQPFYQPAQPETPMKWYKFIIYCQLFLTALINIAAGFVALTGAQYEGAADMVYGVWPSMKGMDLFYGIALIAVGAFAIYVRQLLAKYKKNGPNLYLIMCAATIILSLIYIFGVQAITGVNGSSGSTTSNLVTSIVMIIVNKIYFDKRRHLFIN